MSTFWQQHNTLYNNWLRSWWCQRSDNTIHCTTTGREVSDVNVLTTTQYTVQQLVEKLVMSTFWQQHNTLYNNWSRSWWCQSSDNNIIHCTTTGREVGDVNVLTTTQYTVQQLVEKLVMSTFWQQHNTLYHNWLRSWWCQPSDNNTIHCTTTDWAVGDVNVLTTTTHTLYNNWLRSWWCQRSDNNTIHCTTTGREVGEVNVLTTTQYTVQQLVEKLVMSTFWQQHNTLYNNWSRSWWCQCSDNNNNTLYNNWSRSWWCKRSDNNTIHCTTGRREVGDVNVLTTTQYTVQQLVEKLVMSTFWQQHNTLYNNWLRSWWCQRSDNNIIHCTTTGWEVGDVNVLTTT